MQNKKNQIPVGHMIQRCHKLRQKRKQYIDQARTVSDEVERERLLQMGEHYGRVVISEQGRIDSSRDEPEKPTKPKKSGKSDKQDADSFLPDFITEEI